MKTKTLAATLVVAIAVVGCSKPSASSAPPPRAALAAAELSERDRALLRDPAVVRAVLEGASRDDDAETIRSLARHGVDVDTPLGAGRTALTLAAYHRSGRALRELLDAHADPDGKGAALSPLMHAAFVGDEASVRALVLAGAPVDRPTPYGQTPLMFAALFGRQEAYEALVLLGADENATDRIGATPKSLRAYANDASAVEGFLRGASTTLRELARAAR
jgi:ankyrin repeat protein